MPKRGDIFLSFFLPATRNCNGVVDMALHAALEGEAAVLLPHLAQPHRAGTLLDERARPIAHAIRHSVAGLPLLRDPKHMVPNHAKLSLKGDLEGPVTPRFIEVAGNHLVGISYDLARPYQRAIGTLLVELLAASSSHFPVLSR